MQMPATIEELQGVVAGLSEVVKGLVNTVQQQSALLQAHTTASTSQANSADTTSGSNNQHLSTLRLPTLQLPTFRQDKTAQDDIAEFLERFQEQTSHLPAKIRLSLLEQQVVGEWPRSVLSFCRGSEGFSDKSAEEQLNSFISSLRDEFQEPPDAKCRRLAAELSAMKQDPSENVDEFAFKYKNTLHQLDKLGESLTKSCPTYVTSQFISKLQPHLTQHLVLQAHQVTQLDKAIEAARRIEHSFIAAASNGSSSPLTSDSSSPSTVFNGVPQRTALFHLHVNLEAKVSKVRVGFAEIINTKLMNAHNGQQHQKRNRLRSAEILISSSQQLVSNLITSVQLAGFTNVLNVKNGVVKLFVIRNSECSP